VQTASLEKLAKLIHVTALLLQTKIYLFCKTPRCDFRVFLNTYRHTSLKFSLKQTLGVIHMSILWMNSEKFHLRTPKHEMQLERMVEEHAKQIFGKDSL